MPQWFKDMLPDLLKEYAVQTAVALTLFVLGVVWLGAKGVAALIWGRMSADEKSLLRWTYDSAGHCLIAIESFGNPLAITVMEVTLNRDRHRWLLALERLQERGVFDGEMGRGVYRLRASAVALAKKIKPSDPRPHQLPEPAPIEYGQVLIDKAM